MCTTFLFLSDGGLHAHCRRDRTYLFLSASISYTVHEQTGETMNDDVCVLLYSFTSFFFKTVLFISTCTLPPPFLKSPFLGAEICVCNV